VVHSTWTSGNQECNGHKGYLIIKTTNNKQNKKQYKHKLSKTKKRKTTKE